MSSVSLSTDTKRLWDELKPDDATHDEFAQMLLETYQKDVDGVVIDPDEIAEEIKAQVATQVEIAAVRGVNEALDE